MNKCVESLSRDEPNLEMNEFEPNKIKIIMQINHLQCMWSELKDQSAAYYTTSTFSHMYW